MSDYDVIILGGGPGGYLAAERLGHAKKKVLLVEEQYLGGTCLNVGCIPTKSLLNSAKLYLHARHSEQFGVTAGNVAFDWGRVQAWKDEVVTTLVGGVGMAERKAGVEVANAHGTLVGPGVVEVAGERKTADHVIIATGSVPVMPPIPGAKDNPAVVDSTGLLGLESFPSRLAVIGGGVIGVEFASLFAAFGAQVEVIELLPEILPFADTDIASKIRKGIQGVTFHLGCKVTGIEGSTVVYSDAQGVEARTEADVVLMAVGRRPALTGWGAEEAGLETTPRGVVVDDTMRTNLPNVWAVGDVTGRSLLAHAAYRMAEIAVAHILDPAGAARSGQVLRTQTIPWAVYSIPEAAGVGLTQAQAVQQGLDVVTATVPLVLSGRFVAENGLKAPGAVKIIAEKDSRVIRGIHALGPYSPETIWGAAAILESEYTIDDLRQVVFPHPTVSEGIREAAWAINN
ncbi:MAG: dihydrolipoyl dehydrogenase [Propionicimonas sp.]|uniref:dihydrolipoyl dehydrogenase n=1 Tax=Propionicimonas sp. TaxID=1955623 RepID=UPI002B213AEB|nr:dihydrolipoyl dehydrogenase [Propionicimonas sp.]MEA4944172.1 dihydrolipoyl dehydrogenase [Propionicimonas sp.]